MRRFVQDFSGCSDGPCLGPGLDAALAAAPPRYNIAVRKPALVVASVDGMPVALEAAWGLIPAWSKAFETRYTTQTARLERAPSSRIFRAAWRERRCVVPMTGYYKWDRSVKPPVPWFIHAADGGLLLAAGLWERWSKEEPPRDSFAVLTHPNAHIPEPLTPDGPVFLPGDEWQEWLGGKTWFPQRYLKGMRQPALAAYAVSNAVRNAARDDYTLLEPRSVADDAIPPPPGEDEAWDEDE